ncbi:EcsC family protein [Phenylobacterium sp. SCN 70-31]|uniref:EcsC family protein n=1 Tax=Phenylobacterium sp. SCN 70-31 TaxID=1660129 RepID=UPI00086B5C57|nr:EcsC family protein [Phenylobacterium sp. SCN 70-31]ODT86520.1 MAG: ABC transporter-associated protein EcsC [Phenylobacterium sp. SCN 70-31]
MARWRAGVLKPPGPLDVAARGLQSQINRMIPERVHAAVTTVMEGLTRTLLTGADLTTARALEGASMKERDRRAWAAIDGYRATAAVEGGVAGAGGFWLAVADFPALLTIKIKLLFDLAAIYGHEAEAFSERLYILALFQLAFSGAEHRAKVFEGLADWDGRSHPADFADFDWRTFQREYRDYIDLAKLAQLIPVVGAPIGAVVNWRLLERLGETAMNGYRMRHLAP